MQILSNSLKPNGKLIAVEVNGSNIIERFRYFILRGNKTVIELYDEKLNKTILLGNENVRPIKNWRKLFKNNGFQIQPQSIEYVRVFFPFFYKIIKFEKLLKIEKFIWKKNSLIRHYFYFGLNFTATKNS